jgi:hypothetical protein
MLAAAISASAAGCAATSTTAIENTWTAPPSTRVGLHKVVAVYVSPDGAVRRTAEDTMARQLAKVGAVPGYQVLTDEDRKNAKGAAKKLRAEGFDGVIAMRPVAKEQRVQMAYSSAYPEFGPYWGTAWPSAYNPGYLSTETVVRIETSAYALDNERLVWSGLSRTVDPTGVRDLVEGVIHEARRDMEAEGVLPIA